MGEVVVYSLSEGYLSVLLQNGEVVDIGFTPLRGASLFSFTTARVVRKAENLGGFFVDTPWGEAFLPFSEASEGRKVGDTATVQVIREALEDKAPRVGEFFTLPLAGCEVTLNRRGVIFTQPCGESERKKLLRLAKEKNLRLKVFDCFLCLREVERLGETLKGIFENLPFKWFHIYTQLLRGGNRVLSEDRALRPHLEVFERVFRRKVEFKTLPFRELVKVFPPSGLESLVLSERVPFDGGFLLVRETEGLIFIDVNGNLRPAELNRRAAGEIVRLFNLRKWGGLIAVDFVNFKTPAERESFKKWFKEFLLKTPCKGLGFTNGGLYEMLCPRRVRTLSEVLTEKNPYCGRWKRNDFLLLEVLEKIADPKGETPRVKLHPLREGIRKLLEERFNLPLQVEFDCSIPPDRFEVEFG